MLLKTPDALGTGTAATLKSDLPLHSISKSEITEESATLYLGSAIVGEFKSLVIRDWDEPEILRMSLLCGYLFASVFADLQESLLIDTPFKVVTKSLILNNYKITHAHISDRTGEKVVCNCLEGLWFTC